MTHKAAPPETPDQAACREFWSTRLGHSAIGWGRDKSGKFLAEFARNAQAAWTAAREQSASEAEPAIATTGVALLPWADYWQSRGRTDVSHDFGTFQLAEEWAKASITRVAIATVDEAEFHQAIALHATRRSQGYIMGAFRQVTARAAQRTHEVDALRGAAQAVADALGMDGQIPTPDEVQALNLALAPFTTAPSTRGPTA